ncbi:MAG: sugar ABC transporter permease [Erysipelotrichales bacterium]|nr:sugar ABC transporter permease [Erysipelotrichales bacterium]
MDDTKRDGWKALIALLPAAIMLIIFTFFPIINTFTMSFMEDFQLAKGAGLLAINNGFSGIGFKGYQQVLTDPIFQSAIVNTLILVLVSVPLTIVISLLMAVALNGIKKLQGLYQTIFFLPYVTNTIALGMVFGAMFGSADSGVINQIVKLFGGTPKDWTTMNALKWDSFWVIIVYTVWNGLAFKILVFMSGLQSIDKQYYDAAKIDGTSKARILWKITIPLLSPQILYITITSFIGAFKSYTGVISIFGKGETYFGGAGNDWITIVGYIFRQMGSSGKGVYTKAAAAAVILLIIILIVTALQSVVAKKRVHY